MELGTLEPRLAGLKNRGLVVELPVFRCRDCWDTGFIETSPARNIVKPCPKCRRETYERWTQGYHNPSDDGRRYDNQAKPEDRDRKRFGGRRDREEF